MLLPAPLGPTRPMRWPGLMVHDRPSKSSCGPKPLEMSWSWITEASDGELESVTLGVRVVQCCPEDEFLFRFNGEVVAPSRISHFYGGLVSYAAARSGLPERIDTHYWFAFDLPLGLVREGRNKVEVTLEKMFTPLGTVRVLHQVELCLEYRAPLQPTGGQM